MEQQLEQLIRLTKNAAIVVLVHNDGSKSGLSKEVKELYILGLSLLLKDIKRK